MTNVLSIDIETYSDQDITNGVYRYVDTDQFEIQLIGYAFDDEEVKVIDLKLGEKIPAEFIDALHNDSIEKHAFNASFERICLSKWITGGFGLFLPPEHWWCTQKHAAMFGLPSSLKDVGKELNLSEQKDSAGTALINYFCKPCKPSKTNCERTRNLPQRDMAKWELFKKYNRQDVVTERAISAFLTANYPYDTQHEKENYWINERVNDNGVLIDSDLCESVITYNEKYEAEQLKRYKDITGLESPRQAAQFKTWLTNKGVEVTSLTKDTVPDLIKNASDGDVIEALTIRQSLSKTSVTKYQKMIDTICSDGRVHGVMNFYGANRTGRFAGRIIQTQNLPQNHLKELDEVRELVKSRNWSALECIYDDIQDVFKQLIRTAIIAPEDKLLSVADYSAIEARVIAWLAHETETEAIFAPGGSQKIYESTAARMFGVPVETIAKGQKNYDLRQRGKVATLACGYGGGVSAMRRMDTKHMLDDKDDAEVNAMVRQWRKANPHIVKLWKAVEDAAIDAISSSSPVRLESMVFSYDGHNLFITLPSNRTLTYFNARIEDGQITYAGNEATKWCDHLHTYSGKLVENIVQSIARDCLTESIRKLYQNHFKIIFHVHDEIICEVDSEADNDKQSMIMTQNAGIWDEGLYHPAPGYVCKYYQKD